MSDKAGSEFLENFPRKAEEEIYFIMKDAFKHYNIVLSAHFDTDIGSKRRP